MYACVCMSVRVCRVTECNPLALHTYYTFVIVDRISRFAKIACQTGRQARFVTRGALCL